MAEQINQVQPGNDGGSGVSSGVIIGIVVVLLLVLLFFIFGRGMFTDRTTDINVDVPENLPDVNVNAPDLNNNGGAEPVAPRE